MIADLRALSADDLAHLAAHATLGAERLDDPFVAATFRALHGAAQDESRRRAAQRPAFPHYLSLPIDPDADPDATARDLRALGAVVQTLRDRAAVGSPALAGVYGALLADLAEFEGARRRLAGELADLFGSAPAV